MSDDLFAGIAAEPREVALFVYLDPEWSVLGTRRTTDAAVAHVTVPLRRIVADALELDAAAVVMAHNHPAGDPWPSAADHALTRRVARALDLFGIRLVDHVIVAPGARLSFRREGLL